VRDLLCIVPTRGRPGGARELITAFRGTHARAHLVFAVDDDDPALPEYRRIDCPDGIWFRCGPQKTLSGWTNLLAGRYAGSYRALMSLGDDHRPRTDRWDAKLLAALAKTGGTGIAYGDDLIQGRQLPTAAVVSSDIVRSLGWMCLPSLRHYYVDDTWKLLGASAGCLHWCPDVIVEHVHPIATGATPDATYLDAQNASYMADRAAFRDWRHSETGQAAIDTVRALMRVTAA